MTAPSPLLDDQSLAALAFLDAVNDGNKLNWSHSLARVAATLAHGLAANTGATVGEVFEVHRGLFLHYGNPGGES